MTKIADVIIGLSKILAITVNPCFNNGFCFLILTSLIFKWT
jgi:hypothetical protein